MGYLVRWVALVALLSLAGRLSASAQVVVNEVMYHPASENAREEFVEVFNAGAAPANVLGWRLGGGVNLTFSNALTVAGAAFVPVTNLTLAPGGCLVVAANLTNFVAKYPGVTNVIGNWQGQLSNSRETVGLFDGTGDRVNSVSYADEGDWAIRQRGPLDFGFRGWKWFAAHDGLELNTATDNYEGGRSLELVNAIMPNSSGQNWLASSVTNGTPGQPNSVVATNIAPLILEAAHYPPVPNPTDPVTITARVLDEQTNGVSVALHYRNHSTTNPPAFMSVPMLDNGGPADGLAGDRLFGVVLPAQTNGAVIEFYISATDEQAHTRTWPAAARQLDGSFAQTCNALYQVDENLDPPSASNTGQPLYRLVLTESERVEFQRLMDDPGGQNTEDSNAEMNATFISSDGTGVKLRYHAGLRVRGEGSRSRHPPNWRVNIPTDRSWNERSAINLNVQFVHAQLAGSAFALASGLAAAEARVVQVRLNGLNHTRSGLPVNGSSTGAGFGSYVMVEPINNEWADQHFPGDGNGNVYRASSGSWYANLDYEGTNLANYTNASTGGYFKTSNTSENDWTDLLDLTYALSTNTPDASYVQTVSNHANIENFLRYFAVVSALDYSENGLPLGVGDDYAMYRGLLDPRFILVPHDLDTVLGQGDTTMDPNRSIWRVVDSPASSTPEKRVNFVRRLLRRPDTAPIYFRELQRLCDTTLAAAQFDALLDQTLGGWVPENIISGMKLFGGTRRASILAQLPTSFTVVVPLTQSNSYFRTTSASMTLRGTANALETKTVVVGGSNALWSVWEGRWTNSVGLLPGLNNVLVQCLNAANDEIARTNVTIWRDTGSIVSVGGTLPGSTTWSAAGGPYLLTNSLTVPAGASLTIEPGTTIYLGTNVSFTVNGRLHAEGTEIQRIRFTRQPGAGGQWASLNFNNTGTNVHRLAFVDFDFGGSGGNANLRATSATLFLNHVVWANTTSQLLDLTSSSITLLNSVLPTIQNNELLHFSGMPANGHALIQSNVFGTTSGYNDIIDFTGGNRPGPIVRFLDNVFTSAVDDVIDLDGTDAHIEGNIFTHIHQDAARDSASHAISTGAASGNTSELVIVRNLFFDCDHALLLKEGASAVFDNNTVVTIRTNPPSALPAGVINFGEPQRNVPGGLGATLNGNLVWDLAGSPLALNFTNAIMSFTVNRTLIEGTNWPGIGNLGADPRFVNAASNAITWQNIRSNLVLRPSSPALGAGPNGLDMGAIVPAGASISGEPPPVTCVTNATLTIAGPGITHYSWRLNNGSWSAETAVSAPLVLNGLGNGTYSVQVVGKNDAGDWQSTNAPTLSRAWTVNTALTCIRLNELLARNVSTLITNGEAPDLVELFNFGSASMNLAGMGLTDDPAVPFKFTFPTGPFLAPGEFRVLFAENGPDPAHFLGFALNNDGDALYLFDAPARGGALLDTVSFGPQVNDLALGRRVDGSWSACQPTFGGVNQPQPTGDPFALRINEWLASGSPLAPDDFVELYNPEPVPVALGGLFLTDAPDGAPQRNEIAALSFIPPGGFIAFKADGNTSAGAEHLNFKLPPEQGRIGLFAPGPALIDQVTYGPQSTGLSQGRRPNGAGTLAFFATPTPGFGNPGGITNVTSETHALLPMTNTWRFNQTSNFTGVNWFATNYNDGAWSTGRALLYVESASLPAPKLTPLNIGQTTYYFRTGFHMPTNPAGFALTLRTVLDDGAVLYLNGAELVRIGMTNGLIGHTNLASRSVTDAVLETFNLTSVPLLEGTNFLAVEVHQSDNGSSDVVWGLALDAVRTTTNFINLPLVLSEVVAASGTLTNSDGSLSDWVELFNPSADSVNLAGFSLTDDTPASHRWYFPVGTSLAGGARLIVKFDGDSPPATNAAALFNTGFSLNASGDAVYLYSAAAALLDAVVFGPQAEGFSLGRLPAVTGSWQLALPTPGSDNLAAELGNPTALRINEWAASVSGGPDWFELYNPGLQPIALAGLYLTDKLNERIKHPIAALSFIGTGTNGFLKFIADNNTAQGADHVGFSLDAGGEAIGLFPTGTAPAIDMVTFGPQTNGISEGRFPDSSPNRAFFTSPSPGEANWLFLTNVFINEVLTHTDLPLEDAIELHNPGNASVNISGWWLSDTSDELRKFRIPTNTILAPHGFAVFYEYQFNPEPGFPGSFSFSSARGDSVWLSATDGDGQLNGFRARVNFGPQFNGVSFGRVPTSIGADFTALEVLTFGHGVTAQSPPDLIGVFRGGAGAVNALPRIGPVVISEIMYRPPLIGTNDNLRDEFVELYNLTFNPVPLYDLAHATNGWRLRGGVDFDFNTNHSLAPGSFLLLVSFDPATNGASLTAFRAAYGTNGTLVGPYSGKLDNGGEAIELYAPDAPQTTGSDFGLVPYVLVERVVYDELPPWPAGADGSGASLQRMTFSAYGNDPANWIAATPTAGFKAGGDSDGDGMPDTWEDAHNLNRLVNDAALDPDHDGFTNGQEYLAGTDPQNAASALRILSAAPGVSGTDLRFEAIAGRTYSILYRDSLTSGLWQKLADVPAPGATQILTIHDPASATSNRFYQLATPGFP